MQSERQWYADNLRLTAFPSPSSQFNVAGQWEQVVGHAPDSQTIQPARGIVEETGKFNDGQLQLTAQPVRIDWNYVIGNFSDPGLPPSNIEAPFVVALGSFLQVAERWLPVGPSLRRLAFGAVLLRPVSDRVAGYQGLIPYLQEYVRISPERSSDFSYQINRPRRFDDELKIKINRLSKWSVGQAQVAQFALTPGTTPYVSVGQATTSIRLELDINTDAEFQGDLPPQRLPELFRELVNQGNEIAERGDVE